MLERGSLLFVDYGLVRADYYHEQRADGTFVCHYRHRAHDDPFVYPGLQDITAWVDFSACADAATAAGFEVGGFTTQGQYLLSVLAALPPELAVDLTSPREQSALKTLILPGEMGERFKVLLLRKNVSGAGVARQGFPPSAVMRRFEPLHRIERRALLRSRASSVAGGALHALSSAPPLAARRRGAAGSRPRRVRAIDATDDAGGGWMLGLGAQADEDEATACSARCYVGVGSSTWLTFVAGQSSSPADRADIEADTLVLGVDHRFDQVGFTLEAERWGDPGALETEDLAGSVYFDRGRWRIGFGYESARHRDPVHADGAARRHVAAHASTVRPTASRVNARVALGERWQLYLRTRRVRLRARSQRAAADRELESAEHVDVDAREQLSRPRALCGRRARVRPSDVVERARHHRSLRDRRFGVRDARKRPCCFRSAAAVDLEVNLGSGRSEFFDAGCTAAYCSSIYGR